MTVDNSQNKEVNESPIGPDQQAEAAGLESRGRRLVVRKIAAGSAAVAGLSVLPGKWVAPLVEFGTLPAHAITTGALEAVVERVNQELEKAEEKTTTDDQAATDGFSTSSGTYTHSETIPKTGDIMIDRVLRSKFVSPKLGPQYGPTMHIVFDSGEEMFVPDTSKHVDTVPGRGYRPGRTLVETPTMEVYADPGSRARSITIYFNG
ncbi:hypothetical protein SAMN02745124_01500 [Desulfofustis glycolicus DSM 9705]|uniref:Uncharacterized protein n=2 Tax=Desulfofustis glycolicus TaxID=51195 RepID=A0A1M5V5D1_9BACT|nr:hypothetical protein SAMN02745124_01500 [Desulfofustis glycolicus DSM 9705]